MLVVGLIHDKSHNLKIREFPMGKDFILMAVKTHPAHAMIAVIAVLGPNSLNDSNKAVVSLGNSVDLADFVEINKIPAAIATVVAARRHIKLELTKRPGYWRKA
ncbi:MAG: hypothetical protein CMK92_05810 [Pseudomonas sp.]|nr:hypothetical protein [Pseudomonas sp.]